MVNKPPLPDGYDLPGEVNGWIHDPESKKNGHVWTASDAPKSVAVFNHIGTARVAIFDDRVDGFDNNVEPYREEVADGESKVDASAEAVGQAVSWMETHAPAKWAHPHVEEAVFDAPVGYSLDRYYLEQREAIVNYRRDGRGKAVQGFSDRDEDDPAYLVVKVWRGSGNATVATAPWLRAHDHQMTEVADPPEECGLPVALKCAREYAREVTGLERESPAAGQSGIQEWSV